VKESVVYIATDRLYAGRLRIHGGYNYMPSMEKMASHGTVYTNATATAGSTLMTHSSEWTGKYTAELHEGIPFEERLYNTEMPPQDTVFTDFLERGYNVYVVLVEKRPGKTYDSFRPVFKLWPETTKIVKIPDWDIKGGEKIRRKEQIMKIADLVEESEKEGKPAFVFLKCHGYNKTEYRSEYLRYAGQQRVTDDDLYNCEIDEALGELLDHFGYPGNSEAPTIWFASDHGSWAGESFRNHYGYHLDQEIVHVPVICSRGGGKVVDSVFSMKEIRRMLTGDSPNMTERYIFAETLYPGQVTKNPDNGILSTAKIMVRLNRYKYIYSLHGKEGDGEPTEELYDLAYDPREKFNLAEAFVRIHKDVARPAEGGVPFHHVSSRINTNTKKATRPEILPKKSGELEFVNTLQLSGWHEIHSILEKLRMEAKNYWTRTGRADYFHF
jgi:hypothetical protein